MFVYAIALFLNVSKNSLQQTRHVRKGVASMAISSQRSVLILGARGRLGAALTTAFSQREWTVLAHTRTRSPSSPHVEVVADALDTRAIVSSAKVLGYPQIDVVINACNPVYTKWRREALPLNAAAIESARSLNATLMFPGNVYNFGAAMPAELTTETAQAAQTRKGLIRIEMEQQLESAAKSGLQSIVIRAGDFFGCASGSWFDLVIAKDIARNKLTMPGSMDIPRAWAYVPDLAQSFVNAAEARATLNRFECIHFPGHTLTLRDMIGAIERVTRRTYKVGKLPWPVIQAFAFAVPMWREIAELRYLWERPHQLLPASAHQSLIAPTTPLDHAISHALSQLELTRSAVHQQNTQPVNTRP
jgi:nucleoside-diphosphate-sugar epimerase